MQFHYNQTGMEWTSFADHKRLYHDERGAYVGCTVPKSVLDVGKDSPWPDGLAATNTSTSAVIENSPRHLDPTASYWSNDTPYTYQIYEPPYGYHYLKRPFQLVPKSAREVARPRYIDNDGQPRPELYQRDKLHLTREGYGLWRQVISAHLRR